MNKTKTIMLVACLLVTSLFYAQRRPDGDKIKALKVAFITERLSLTSNEAQSFWPIYNEHEQHMEDFRGKERSEIRDKLKDVSAISDKEAESLLNQLLLREKEKQEEQRMFVAKLRKVISAKKMLLLLRSEEDFKRQLIKQYREKQRGGNR